MLSYNKKFSVCALVLGFNVVVAASPHTGAVKPSDKSGGDFSKEDCLKKAGEAGVKLFPELEAKLDAKDSKVSSKTLEQLYEEAKQSIPNTDPKTRELVQNVIVQQIFEHAMERGTAQCLENLKQNPSEPICATHALDELKTLLKSLASKNELSPAVVEKKLAKIESDLSGYQWQLSGLYSRVRAVQPSVARNGIDLGSLAGNEKFMQQNFAELVGFLAPQEAYKLSPNVNEPIFVNGMVGVKQRSGSTDYIYMSQADYDSMNSSDPTMKGFFDNLTPFLKTLNSPDQLAQNKTRLKSLQNSVNAMRQQAKTETDPKKRAVYETMAGYYGNRLLSASNSLAVVDNKAATDAARSGVLYRTGEVLGVADILWNLHDIRNMAKSGAKIMATAQALAIGTPYLTQAGFALNAYRKMRGAQSSDEYCAAMSERDGYVNGLQDTLKFSGWNGLAFRGIPLAVGSKYAQQILGHSATEGVQRTMQVLGTSGAVVAQSIAPVKQFAKVTADLTRVQNEKNAAENAYNLATANGDEGAANAASKEYVQKKSEAQSLRSQAMETGVSLLGQAMALPGTFHMGAHESAPAGTKPVKGAASFEKMAVAQGMNKAEAVNIGRSIEGQNVSSDAIAHVMPQVKELAASGDAQGAAALLKRADVEHTSSVVRELSGVMQKNIGEKPFSTATENAIIGVASERHLSAADTKILMEEALKSPDLKRMSSKPASDENAHAAVNRIVRDLAERIAPLDAAAIKKVKLASKAETDAQIKENIKAFEETVDGNNTVNAPRVGLAPAERAHVEQYFARVVDRTLDPSLPEPTFHPDLVNKIIMNRGSSSGSVVREASKGAGIPKEQFLQATGIPAERLNTMTRETQRAALQYDGPASELADSGRLVQAVGVAGNSSAAIREFFGARLQNKGVPKETANVVVEATINNSKNPKRALEILSRVEPEKIADIDMIDGANALATQKGKVNLDAAAKILSASPSDRPGLAKNAVKTYKEAAKNPQKLEALAQLGREGRKDAKVTAQDNKRKARVKSVDDVKSELSKAGVPERALSSVTDRLNGVKNAEVKSRMADAFLNQNAINHLKTSPNDAPLVTELVENAATIGHVLNNDFFAKLAPTQSSSRKVAGNRASAASAEGSGGWISESLGGLNALYKKAARRLEVDPVARAEFMGPRREQAADDAINASMQEMVGERYVSENIDSVRDGVESKAREQFLRDNPSLRVESETTGSKAVNGPKKGQTITATSERTKLNASEENRAKFAEFMEKNRTKIEDDAAAILTSPEEFAAKLKDVAHEIEAVSAAKKPGYESEVASLKEQQKTLERQKKHSESAEFQKEHGKERDAEIAKKKKATKEEREQLCKCSGAKSCSIVSMH